jgi:hypothetical protein
MQLATLIPVYEWNERETQDRTVLYSDNTHVDETTVVDDSNVCALESQELYVSDKETGDE